MKNIFSKDSVNIELEHKYKKSTDLLKKVVVHLRLLCYNDLANEIEEFLRADRSIGRSPDLHSGG